MIELSVNFAVLKPQATWSILQRRNFETQQSPLIQDLRLRKTRAVKSHGYRDPTHFRSAPSSFHKNRKPTFIESCFLKKLHLRVGILWTAGLTVEKKLFQISPRVMF